MSDDGLVPAKPEDLILVADSRLDTLDRRVDFLAGEVADARSRLVLLEERFDGHERLLRDINRNVSKMLDIAQCKTCKRHKAAVTKR